jgi:hypothetical protein
MTQKQTLLRIGLPRGKRLYPSEFREMLAKIPSMPSALFHVDENRVALNDRPGIRVVGATGWVGLVADEENKLLLREATGAAIMAVSERTGQACSVEIEEHEFGLKPTFEPKVYWVREMVIKQRGKRARELDPESLIRDRIVTSLEATCEKYGIDCPTVDQLGIETIEAIRPRGLPLQTTTGVTKEFVMLVDARVLIHADLNGMWFVGNLTSRGYGRIIKERPGMRFDAPRSSREVVQ